MFHLIPHLTAIIRSSFILILPLFFYSCGKIPNSSVPVEQGSLIIRTQFIKTLSKQSANLESTFDSLVVEINGTDFNTPIHWSTPLDHSLPVIIDTIPSIPSGTSRTVRIWTVSRNGIIIHRDSIESHIVRIDPGKTTPINAILLPAVGSIYIQIGKIPTTIDSIKVVYTSTDGRSWASSVRRSTRVYIAIDAIPHMTDGTLLVETLNSAGEIINRAQTPLLFNAFKTEAITLDFSSSGGSISLNTTILLPGASVASLSLGSAEVAKTESGNCIISEIMFAANDSEYIEIYNNSSMPVNYDTLILEIDGTKRIFENVSIVSNGYYVFGRKSLPWVDQAHTVLSALDLSSNGNWITLRTVNQILDQVIFSEGQNGLGWPIVNGKRSIELSLASYSEIENNFGRNWVCANTLIESSTSLYGTPGF